MRQQKKNKTLFKKRNKEKQGYIIRPVEKSDIISLLRLEREVYAGVLQWSKITFERELLNPIPHLYLLIERHQEVIAFIGARFERAGTHITNLVVSPRYQHQGIATYLMQRVEKSAKRRRQKRIHLEVRMTNFEAKRFYRHLGYKTIEITNHYYVDNGEDAVVMEKKI